MTGLRCVIALCVFSACVEAMVCQHGGPSGKNTRGVERSSRPSSTRAVRGVELSSRRDNPDIPDESPASTRSGESSDENLDGQQTPRKLSRDKRIEEEVVPNAARTTIRALKERLHPYVLQEVMKYFEPQESARDVVEGGLCNDVLVARITDDDGERKCRTYFGVWNPSDKSQPCRCPLPHDDRDYRPFLEDQEFKDWLPVWKSAEIERKRKFLEKLKQSESENELDENTRTSKSLPWFDFSDKNTLLTPRRGVPKLRDGADEQEKKHWMLNLISVFKHRAEKMEEKLKDLEKDLEEQLEPGLRWKLYDAFLAAKVEDASRPDSESEGDDRSSS